MFGLGFPVIPAEHHLRLGPRKVDWLPVDGPPWLLPARYAWDVALLTWSVV